MYKDRIKKWRLERKNKESDMLAILRKKTEREAAGKSSSLRVRGQPVTIEEVLHYFKRKKNIRDEEAYNAPTPSDVSCRTPSPAPVVTLLENDPQMVTTNSFSWADLSVQTEETSYLSAAQNFNCTEVDDIMLPRARFVLENEHILQWTLRDMNNLISHDEGIPRSPSPPQTLLIPEQLFLAIRTYMDGAFERGSWITDEYGYCTIINTFSDGVSASPVDFENCCLSALTLLNNGWLVRFRRILAKAFKIVDTMIRANHPRTLEIIVGNILSFKANGRPELVKLLLRYIVSISLTVWTKDHPWGQIGRLIGMLEEDVLEQVLIQSWRCMIDSVEKSLGPFHHSTLVSKLRFIGRVYDSIHLFEAENYIRKLLQQYKEEPSIPTSDSLEIMIRLGWNLFFQGHYAKAEQLGQDVLSQSEDDDSFDGKLNALELISHSQYRQNQRVPAEKNIRHAIHIVADECGAADAWAINLMLVLEEWLEEWGREEEAGKLKAEIDEAIGRDEIDELGGYWDPPTSTRNIS
jgi:hypothetical protein